MELRDLKFRKKIALIVMSLFAITIFVGMFGIRQVFEVKSQGEKIEQYSKGYLIFHDYEDALMDIKLGLFMTISGENIKGLILINQGEVMIDRARGEMISFQGIPQNLVKETISAELKVRELSKEIRNMVKYLNKHKDEIPPEEYDRQISHVEFMTDSFTSLIEYIGLKRIIIKEQLEEKISEAQEKRKKEIAFTQILTVMSILGAFLLVCFLSTVYYSLA